MHVCVCETVCGFMYACTHRCGCTHAYLSFKPLDLSVLVFQLSAKLIGCDLLSLHDLDEVDVLLHKDLTLNDDVRVTKWSMGKGVEQHLKISG